MQAPIAYRQWALWRLRCRLLCSGEAAQAGLEKGVRVADALFENWLIGRIGQDEEAVLADPVDDHLGNLVRRHNAAALDRHRDRRLDRRSLRGHTDGAGGLAEIGVDAAGA